MGKMKDVKWRLKTSLRCRRSCALPAGLLETLQVGHALSSDGTVRIDGGDLRISLQLMIGESGNGQVSVLNGGL